MSAVIERAGQVAREILEARDPYGTELRCNVFCAAMLAEAYARGFAAGLGQAEDVVRIERESVNAELG